MNKYLTRIYTGLIKENPTFVLMLGMCPTLATTTSAVNALGMGLTTMSVLVITNISISLLRNIIPKNVRIPAYIVLAASVVTIAELLLHAYAYTLYNALGVYIPLIVVNCIILGRAESFASKNPVLISAFDALGMGLGFTAGLTITGIIREFLGRASVFGYDINSSFFGGAYRPAAIFVMAPGAFFVLAGICALKNKISANKACADCEAGCRGCMMERGK